MIVWSIVLLLTSSDLFSSSHSGSLMATLFGRYLSPAQLETLNFVFRKCMHLTGYGILGWLGFRAARGEARGFSMKWAVTGVLITLVVASIDEWHQTLIPSRGGSAKDVLLDCCGAVIAQVFTAMRNLRH